MVKMNNESQFLVYSLSSEDVKVKAIVKDETIWLTQRATGELFDCSSDNISVHLKNIYEHGKLLETATTEKISVVRQEGNSQKDNGKGSADNAKIKANAEYDIYDKTQKIKSDFDKAVKLLAKKERKDE